MVYKWNQAASEHHQSSIINYDLCQEVSVKCQQLCDNSTQRDIHVSGNSLTRKFGEFQDEITLFRRHVFPLTVSQLHTSVQVS